MIPTVTLPVDPLVITDITDYENGCTTELVDGDAVIYIVHDGRVSVLTIDSCQTVTVTAGKPKS